MDQFKMRRFSSWLLLGTMLAGSVGAAAHAQGTAGFALPAAERLGTQTGMMPAAMPMHIVLSLPLRDEAGAAAFVTAVSTPGSAAYGRYLSPAQFAARFGATQEQYDAVLGWARANGLAAEASGAARTVVDVTGTAETVGRLFSTRIGLYKTKAGQTAFAPIVAPRMPDGLSGLVSGVVGLASTKRFATLAVQNTSHKIKSNNTGVGGALSPADLRTAYVITPPLTTARTETVAVFEQGGFDPRDVAVYEQQYGLRKITPVVRNVSTYQGGINDVGVELEAVLDLDMIIATNQVLKGVLVYEDGDDAYPVALLDSLQAMATDDVAKVVSISYGANEFDLGQAAAEAEHQVLLQMAAEGQTVFAAAGDGGAYGANYDDSILENVVDPASQPTVMGVGGTTLSLFSNGNYEGESAWNELGEDEQDGGATGGGVSTFWKLPSYQSFEGASVAKYNGGSSKMRNVPDVTAVGDPQTGVSVYSALNGGWLTIGGTSASAPIWAGFTSGLNASRYAGGLPRLGFFNPVAYFMGENQLGTNDVFTGTNGDPYNFAGYYGYSAGYGYDNVSGWGSFDGSTYIGSLMTVVTAAGTPATTPVGLHAIPSATEAKIEWSPGTNAVGYMVQLVPLGGGNAFTRIATMGLSAKFCGLSPSTTYLSDVVSLNPAGAAYSSPLYFTTASAKGADASAGCVTK